MQGAFTGSSQTDLKLGQSEAKGSLFWHNSDAPDRIIKHRWTERAVEPLRSQGAQRQVSGEDAAQAEAAEIAHQAATP